MLNRCIEIIIYKPTYINRTLYEIQAFYFLSCFLLSSLEKYVYFNVFCAIAK